MLNFFKKEKSASLQNQPNRTGFNGQPTDDQSLEFLMYGASAYKNQDFVKSQVINCRFLQCKFPVGYLVINLYFRNWTNLQQIGKGSKAN